MFQKTEKQSVPQILIWNTITARPCYKKLFFFVSSSNNVSINSNLPSKIFQVLSNVTDYKMLLMLLDPLPSFLPFSILNKGHFCHLKKNRIIESRWFHYQLPFLNIAQVLFLKVSVYTPGNFLPDLPGNIQSQQKIPGYTPKQLSWKIFLCRQVVVLRNWGSGPELLRIIFAVQGSILRS